MKVQKIQNNNYNTKFSAKVTILDKDKLIADKLKKTFTEICSELGTDSDEIFLSVKKYNKKGGKVEKNHFEGEINRGFYGYDYCISGGEIVKGAKKYLNTELFENNLPVWISQEYSMPRNLTKIYADYILPVFNKNNRQIIVKGDNAYNKLTSAAK